MISRSPCQPPELRGSLCFQLGLNQPAQCWSVPAHCRSLGQMGGSSIFSSSLLPPRYFSPLYQCSAFTVGRGAMNPSRTSSQVQRLLERLLHYFLLAGRRTFFFLALTVPFLELQNWLAMLPGRSPDPFLPTTVAVRCDAVAPLFVLFGDVAEVRPAGCLPQGLLQDR